MTDRALRLTLRSLAIVIALLAVIDPTLTRSRSDRPTVAVVLADAHADSASAARVRAGLDDEFVVVAGAFGAADATVVVGDALPPRIAALAAPVFVAAPEGAPRLTIERVAAPRRAGVESRLAVTPAIRARNARGRTVEVVARVNGRANARATVNVTNADTLVDVPLTIVPSGQGVADLEVSATLAGAGSVEARADLGIDIGATPLRVLFHDARPSWTSTFVRRAIERDPRFAVASRISTTRNAASDAGRPVRLEDRSALETFDAVVVGAPEALSANENAALERFMRSRGGSVLLLPDTPFPSSQPVPVPVPVPVVEWSNRSGGSPLSISRSTTDTASLRAIELTWPSRLPAGAEAIAFTSVARSDTARRAIVWSAPVGAGNLVVSGALDAWRFRDAANSGFDRFWRELIATEASRSPRPVEVVVTPSVVEPGARATVSVTLREPAIAGAQGNVESARAIVRAELQRKSAIGVAPLRLWPGSSVGTFTGEFRATLPEGEYQVRVISGLRDTTTVPVVVRAGARQATPSASGALAAYAASTGGAVVASADLAGALKSAIEPAARSEPWNPMRNPWWILPFALLLSAEWLLRRRRGAP